MGLPVAKIFNNWKEENLWNQYQVEELEGIIKNIKEQRKRKEKKISKKTIYLVSQDLIQ